MKKKIASKYFRPLCILYIHKVRLVTCRDFLTLSLVMGKTLVTTYQSKGLYSIIEWSLCLYELPGSECRVVRSASTECEQSGVGQRLLVRRQRIAKVHVGTLVESCFPNHRITNSFEYCVNSCKNFLMKFSSTVILCIKP